MNSFPFFKKKNLLLVLFIFVCSSLLFSQTTIWSENFNSYANGVTSGTATGASPSQWTTQNGAAVTGGLILASSTVSSSSSLSNPLVWSSNSITISNYTNVGFSLTAEAFNASNFENSGGGQDNYTVEYRVNGSSWIEVFNRSGSSSQPVTGTYSISAILGNTLEIRARFHNTASNENYTLDNILVTGTSINSTNAPPVITATGNQNYCPGTQIPVVQSISITDPDNTTAQSVSVQISSGYINGEDVLSLTGTHPNITASWSVIEGKLTLNGPATLAAFETAVTAVRYSSSSSSPSGSRSFSISVGDANFLPATGHYYEFVPNLGITWTAARDAAALRTYYGLQGYLATLTSLAESQFSGSQAQGTGWIGASDEAVEGDWRWVTGPEAGTPFWTGTASGNTVAPTNFAYWNGGEPNQAGNEDYAHITDPSVVRNGAPVGSWNDLSNTGAGGGPYQPQGYVVEYGGSAGDPIINVTATTSIQMDAQAPTWITTTGALDENYQCTSDVPSLGICNDLSTTFFGQQQFFWGFGLQNNTGAVIPNWEVRINNANYQLNPTQLSNQSAFTYTEINNGNGTYNLILKGTSAIPGNGGIPGGNIQWSGVNFGFNPTSSGISIFCGNLPNILPVATDNCGSVTVLEVSNVTVNNGCANNYIQTISYQAVDANGNLSVPFIKTITVNDTTAPTASNLNEINVFCSAEIPLPNPSLVNDALDNCTANPMVSFVSDVSDGLSNPETITRTYSVTDACSNSINVTQMIRVNTISITIQPNNQVLFVGETAVFSVESNNANSFQWQVSTNGGSSFINISGATNAILNVSNISLNDTNNLYRVVVANASSSSCPSILSNNGLLTVKPRTVITNRRITYRVNNN